MNSKHPVSKCRAGILAGLFMFLCLLVVLGRNEKFMNSCSLFLAGVTSSERERAKSLLFALEDLPDKPIAIWSLSSFKDDAGAIKLMTDAMKASISERYVDEFIELIDVASGDGIGTNQQLRMTAIASLGYMTKKHEEVAQLFADMLRKGETDRIVAASLKEMLWLKYVRMGTDRMLKVVPDYEELTTPNPSKDNPKIEKQDSDSDKDKDKGNKGGE